MAIHPLLLERGRLQRLALQLLREEDLGTKFLLGDEDILEQNAGENAAADRSAPIDPVVFPDARDDSGTERASGVERTTRQRGAKHDVDEDGEADRQGSETTNRLGVGRDA